MAKHIGIVACSAEGAALCYRTICAEGAQHMGQHAHPEISMHTHPLSEYMKYIDPGDWHGVADLMLDSTRKLASNGADFAICPDNTIHQAMEYVRPALPIPWLHIAEEVVKEAKSQGFSKLAILGTKYLMEGPVYPEACEAQDLRYDIPPENERIEINRIIFEELVYGVFKNASRLYFYQVTNKLREQGCDAVVLGCTEIPLIVNPGESPLPTLDSTRLLACAALSCAI